MSTPIRVVIVDDHPVYRDGLAMLLADVPEVDVIACAGDGQQALDVVANTRPDVVVMDVSMPVMDGIEATARLHRDHPEIGVIVLTMSDDDLSIREAIRVGARGYLLKGAGQAEISRAITSVAAGHAIFGPAVAERVLGYVTAPDAAPSPFANLTSREHEILDLMAAGHSNADIAQRLFLSPKTVRNNVSNIFAKLHVADRAKAIVVAREAGLGRGV